MPRLLVGDERFVFKKQFFRHCKANSNHTIVRICANKPRLWRGELHWPIGELHLGYPAARGQACPCVGKGASNFDTKPETVKSTKHEARKPKFSAGHLAVETISRFQFQMFKMLPFEYLLSQAQVLHFCHLCLFRPSNAGFGSIPTAGGSIFGFRIQHNRLQL